MPRRRPLLLEPLDEMAQRFLMATRIRGELVSTTITIAAAKALIPCNPQYNLGNVVLDSSAWPKSPFKRMGLTKRMSTTRKIEIPAGAKKQVELLFMQESVALVEERNIPSNLIMNLEQTVEMTGQMTVEVLDILPVHNIYLCKVPANTTPLFQSLDLTVNNHCKVFAKNKFAEWFTKQVENLFKLGLKLEYIQSQSSNIQFRLTTMKPLYVHWLVQFYNHITSVSGTSIIINGWKATGIFDAIKLCSAEKPSLDPF